MSQGSKVVEVVATILAVPVITFGLYVIAHGHLTPGGGFQGGTIIATAFALLFVAFWQKALDTIKKELLVAFECIALLGFIGLAYLGLSRTFFFNFLANSGLLFGQSVSFGPNQGIVNTAGVIPLMNFFVGLEVSCGLTIIMLSLFGSGDEHD